MCNIAGYAGSRQAAPILVEMLRQQEYYDGNLSTGVVTIHEGTLYYRKIVGSVDTLVAKSDVLDLPGTIGIAHTRPSGNPSVPPLQPYVNEEETAALATNGFYVKHPYLDRSDSEIMRLLQEGYTFQNIFPEKFKRPRHPKSGWTLYPPEVRLKLVDMYYRECGSYTKALALTSSVVFADNAMVTISENAPDSIFALRTTRPLLALEEPGETYLATCRYAFPEEKRHLAKYLPLSYSCEINRQGLHISQDKIDCEPVPEITEAVFEQGYARLCEKLRVPKEQAFYFDDLEFAVWDMKEIFEGTPTLVPHAQLVYDVLWRLEQEGKLCKELRTQEKRGIPRQRWYFWLED